MPSASAIRRAVFIVGSTRAFSIPLRCAQCRLVLSTSRSGTAPLRPGTTLLPRPTPATCPPRACCCGAALDLNKRCSRDSLRLGRNRCGDEAMRVIGVDGCPGGWVSVAYEAGAGTLTPQIYYSFQQLLDANTDAAAIGVDIPIGLSAGSPRSCDLEARQLLKHRRSSVFPAPDPRVLDASSRDEADRRLRGLVNKGVSAQAFGIFRKVAEVNQVVTKDVQDHVFEVHPEVSFWALAGEQPMEHSKKKGPGFEERRRLLELVLGIRIWTREEARSVARPAGPDDLLDATVAAWTARRVAEGRAARLPLHPQVDARGLRMEIVY